MRAGWLCLLLACEPEPWSQEASLEPTLIHLDADESGAVEQAEWEAHAYQAPPFSEVDSDSDGTLSVEELQEVLWMQDPLDFDSVEPKSAPDRGLQSVYFSQHREVRMIRDALRFQVAEILAVAPNYPVPDDDLILRLAKSQDLGSSDLRSTCRDLHLATLEVRLQSPRWLQQCGDVP